MRRTKRGGSFWLCLVINMLLNLEGLIPAGILLALYFIIDLSCWWAVLAAGLWLLWIVLLMALMGWTAGCGSAQDPPKENKNPYSVGNGKQTMWNKEKK